MEKIAGLFEEKLKLYTSLKDVVEQEKAYIVDMDLEGVWASVERKKELAGAIEEIQGEIKALVPQGQARTGFSLSGMVDTLPLTLKEKSGLRKIGVGVDACKREISLIAQKNKQYLTEYLSVIDGIFSTVVNRSSLDQYGNSGGMRPSTDQAPLIEAKV